MRKAVILLFLSTCISAQVRQIDSAKLPQDNAVQHAYQDLVQIDEFARNYASSWPYPVSKSEVTSRFTKALKTLEDAQSHDASNSELRLFTGLVAHLAYNLDIEAAYTPALQLLTQAQSSKPEDFRSTWFLAMHQCESNNPVGGMQNLLSIEAKNNNLPAPFWRDYMLCAQVTSMPAHVLYAYNNAGHSLTGEDNILFKMARNRIKPSSITASYPKLAAWSASQSGDSVRFTSTLCGEALTVSPTASMDVRDVADGKCVVTIGFSKYPSRSGSSSSTALVFTQVAKAGQTLEAFVHSLLSGPKYATAKPVSDLLCPVAKCVAYEIIQPNMYAEEGGAHLLAIAFASEQPPFPGLRLETPQPLPSTSGTGSEPKFFRPQDVLQRFDGTMYTFIALDANQDIYTNARKDFDALMNSIVIDTK